MRRRALSFSGARLLLFAFGAVLAAGPARAQEGIPGVATGLGNRFLQTYTPLTNDDGVFEANFTHRFADAAKDAGPGALWGLGGGSYVSIGVEYVFIKNLSLQISWNNSAYDYEFALKGTLLRPTASLPLAVGLRGGLNWDTAGSNKQSSGFGQVLASYTIADLVTIAASPSYTQRSPYHADIWNVPLDLQVRLGHSWSVLGEWIPKKNWTPDSTYQWSVGVQKSFYHHRFIFYFGNTLPTAIDQLIGGDLNGNVTDVNLHIGFNIARNFEIK
ncbi:MAG TPA: DUF5777 family beta-barrel protein [Thermoanaerobaculia bacterium]|nr:DUF5777 family beta-barrel protein [Thermoanaerobaculia bacterium]